MYLLETIRHLLGVGGEHDLRLRISYLFPQSCTCYLIVLKLLFIDANPAYPIESQCRDCIVLVTVMSGNSAYQILLIMIIE